MIHRGRIRRLVWALLWPATKVCFFRRARFVQDLAIDFFALTEIKKVVAQAANAQRAVDEAEKREALISQKRKLDREYKLEISKLEGLLDAAYAKIDAYSAKVRDADAKLHVAKTQIKENAKGALMIIAEANELSHACAKIEGKGRRLKQLFADHENRIDKAISGKKVSMLSHEG